MPAWRTISRKPLILFILAALFIYSFDSFIIRIPSIQLETEADWTLSAAIMLDFIVVVPLLYYWIVAKRQRAAAAGSAAPLARALPLAAVGAVFAWVTLPPSMRASIWTIELVLLPVEAVFIFYELRLAVTVYRKLRARQADSGQPFPEALAAVLGPGKLNAFVRHDLTVLYYLFGSWRTASQASRTGHTFTYHRKTSLFMTIALFTKILLFEAVAVHLLVRMWSELLAWIMTLGTVWLLAMLWADCRRSVLEPVRLTDTGALIRHGLRMQADIPYSLIAEVQTALELKPPKEQRKDSAEPMLGTANVRIALREPFALEGLLFQPQRVTFIYLALDEPDAFARALRERIR